MQWMQWTQEGRKGDAKIRTCLNLFLLMQVTQANQT